ncbi:MAG: hypothetical protein J7K98_04170 [Candidatus Aenigmarchaeota archaeon]|nr:hypothetical protein [Candidatus Aenigmarchaeota archaeon]
MGKQQLTHKNLEKFIEFHKINAELIFFEEPVMKSKKASEKIKDGIVFKSILLMADNMPVLCVLKGDSRVSFEKVKEIVDAKEVRMAKAKEVLEHTGYDIGGVPPFGHIKKLLVLVDKRLEKLKDRIIYTGGGSHHHLLRINGEELLNVLKSLTNSKVVDIEE